MSIFVSIHWCLENLFMNNRRHCNEKYIYIYIICQNEGGRKNQTLFPVIKCFCILKIWNNNLSKYVLYFKDSSWLTSLKNPFLFYLCSCLLPKIKTIRSEKNFFSSTSHTCPEVHYWCQTALATLQDISLLMEK